MPSFYSLHNGDTLIDIEPDAGEAGSGEAARPTLKLYDNGETTSSVASAFNGFAGFMGSEMQLEKKGLYVAEVKVKLNAVRHVKVFEDLDLGLTQRAAVVTDAWSAGGVEHEVATVKPLVPASALEGLKDFFGPLGQWTPLGNLEPGCIRGDVVPKDMLASGTAQVGGGCKK